MPLKSVFPVIISAMMQPTDQMSTETEAPASGLRRLGRGAHTDWGGGDTDGGGGGGGVMGAGAIWPTTPHPAPHPAWSLPTEQPPQTPVEQGAGGQLLTRLRVVHPVQDDLGRPVPPGHHVPGHLAVCLPGQAEVQDL